MTTPGWRTGWRTSTPSGNGSNCVEVDFTEAGVEMRDSKAHGAGPIINFTPTQWAAFLDDLSSGSGTVTVTHQDGTRVQSTSGVTLRFTPAEWTAFVAGGQDGEFDYGTQTADCSADSGSSGQRSSPLGERGAGGSSTTSPSTTAPGG